MAGEEKILKRLRLLENLISCKMVSQVKTILKNLKSGQTVHGLISSLMHIVALLKKKYNGLNYIAISKEWVWRSG